MPQGYVLKCVPHVQYDYSPLLTNDIFVVDDCVVDRKVPDVATRTPKEKFRQKNGIFIFNLS